VRDTYKGIRKAVPKPTRITSRGKPSPQQDRKKVKAGLQVEPCWKPLKRIKRPTDFSREVLERDKLCRLCRCARATEAHHLVRRSQGGDDVLENGIGLCTQCHQAYHAGNLKIERRMLRLENIEYIERLRKGHLYE